MHTTHRIVSTERIAFDPQNPRIKVALEKYGDKLDEQRHPIRLADCDRRPLYNLLLPVFEGLNPRS